MALLDPFKNFVQTLRSQFASEYYLFVTATLGLAVVGLVTYGAMWGPSLLANPWFLTAVALLLAVGLYLGIRYVVPRFRERIFIKRSDTDYPIAGQESPEEFAGKFEKAVQTLKSLPQLKGKENPLYVLPWYLLIGEEQSGKTMVLCGTTQFSPLLASTRTSTHTGPTQNFNCWLSNTAVVFDTAGRYVTQADKARDRAEWYQLLRLLRKQHEYEPINGVIITVAAPTLATQPDDKLQAEGSRLRERCEEMVKELGCDFPLYLLITKCDQIENFRTFFSLLPRRVQDEALGYVNDLRPGAQPGAQLPRGEEALVELGRGLQLIYDRLHRFRLSLLDARGSESIRSALFCFPEEIRALQSAIEAFATPLFSYDTRYHTPMFRGIFFCSAKQHGAPVSLVRNALRVGGSEPVQQETNTPYFLADLFRTIIPRDRGLVTITARERRRRGFLRVFGIGGASALLVGVAGLVLNAYRIDKQILGSIDLNRCHGSATETPAQPLLDDQERCRVVVQTLIDQNLQRPWWSKVWGLTKSASLEPALQDRYIRSFQIQVLAPLNANLERAIEAADEPMALILFLARRLRLTQICLSPNGCPQPLTAEVEPDYALMLDPQSGRPPVEATAKLKTLHTAYLAWQPRQGGSLQRDFLDDQQRLNNLLSTGQYSVDRLLTSVNRRSPPITYDQYWELPPLPSALSSPTVDSACTKKSWEPDIAPFLDQLQGAAPQSYPQLLAFRQKYSADCLAQWQRFLVGFSRGAERWQGPERRLELARRILTDASPYQRVLTDAWTNIASWMLLENGTNSAPWAEAMRTYFSSEQRQAYIEALYQISERLKDEPFIDVAFKLASDVIGEGQPPEKATNPVQRAWFLASQFSQQTNGDLGAALLQEPVLYVWRVVLGYAYLSLERTWREQVMAAVSSLAPVDRLIALYGPGGKVPQFEQQFLQPLQKGDPLPGEKFSLPSSIASALKVHKQIQPVLETTYPVQIRVSRRSSIEGSLDFLEEQTILTISCAGKNYLLTTDPRDPTQIEATIPWSYQGCTGVLVAISFNVSERPRRRRYREEDWDNEPPSTERPRRDTPRKVQLTKRYNGPNGVLQFLQDFSDGSQDFQINDFEPDPTTLAVLRDGLHIVNVYYTIRIPPQLQQLTTAIQAEPRLSKPIDPTPGPVA